MSRMRYVWPAVLGISVLASGIGTADPVTEVAEKSFSSQELLLLLLDLRLRIVVTAELARSSGVFDRLLPVTEAGVGTCCHQRRVARLDVHGDSSSPTGTDDNIGIVMVEFGLGDADALSPTFESKFARMEPLADGKFALYFMRYTGKEWVGIFDALSVDECMKAIQDDEWFVP
jgi:hypothetical protein